MWKWIVVAWVVLSLPAALLAQWADQANSARQLALMLCPFCQAVIDAAAEQCPRCLHALPPEEVLWQHGRVRVTTRRMHDLDSADEKRLQPVADAINQAPAAAPQSGVDAGEPAEAWASVPLPRTRRLPAVI
jgi:hypothetical protein